jgi:hypothetical protein
MKRVNAAADRLLGLVLRRIDAGACVPEHGQHCGYYTCGSRCYNNRIQYKKCYLAVDCYGGCTVKTGSFAYWQGTQLAC